jgi:4-amino-4-deoxy-L-arabinose transferase-like glycosyltransferase
VIESETGCPPFGRRTIFLLVAAMVVTAGIRLPLLSVPFERDEGEYAYIAWRMGHNELPYRDWVDQKPPLVFWVYRAALALPLDPVRAAHFTVLLWAAASSGALFVLARRFTNEFWGFVAALLFAFLSCDPLAEGTAANTEIFMLLPLILSQIAFFRSVETSSKSMSILCGALIGIAVGFKQVAAVNWLFVIALIPIFAKPTDRWKKTVRFAVWSFVGILAIAGPISLYFWAQHGLSELMDNVFTHNLEYVGAMTWSDRLDFGRGTLARLAPSEVLVWIFCAVGLIVLTAAYKTTRFTFLLGWLITSGVGVSASGYFFPHYFQQLLPAIALVAVFGARWLCEVQIFGRSSFARLALGVVLVAFPLKTLWPFWFSFTPADAVRRIYPGNFFAEMPEFSARLAQITSPDQRVFVFGAEPELLFYARRVSATRYIFLFPLYGPYRNVRDRQLAAAQEIQRNDPAAAVYVPNDLFFSPQTDQYFTGWTLSYLEHDFVPKTWLIKDSPATAQLVPADTAPAPERFLAVLLVRKSLGQ